MRIQTKYSLLGKIRGALILLLLVTFFNVNAQDCYPELGSSSSQVNDYTGILSDGEIQALEKSIRLFKDSTTIEIAIAIVPSLCGTDKADFSYNLFTKWGVGASGKNNGVLIVVKPKEIDGRGDAFIETGYGMEGVLPDAICKRIIENEMVPYFKQKDYFGGIANAATTVMAISAGEYSADEYAKNKGAKSMFPFLGVIVIFIIMMIMKAGKTRQYASTNNLGFFAALALMNASSRSHGGSFSDFGSGGGSFGGFGGGMSGGGGAGGSW